MCFRRRLLNTARFGYSRADFYFNGDVTGSVPGWVAGAPVGAVVISGSTASNGASQITLAGANTGSNNATVRNLFTGDDHIYWTHGKHQIEAGVWLQTTAVERQPGAEPIWSGIVLNTRELSNKGNVATFTVVPAPTELGWRSLFVAGYFEDAWKVTPRLEVRAGFRSESSTGWNESQSRASNYGFTDGVINTNPTIGGSALSETARSFCRSLASASRTTYLAMAGQCLRASFGLHRRSRYARLPARPDRAVQHHVFFQQYDGRQTCRRLADGATPGSGLISPSNVQPNIATPTVLAWTVKLEQQIAPETSLTIGYVGSHGYHQILSEDQNTPPTVICPAASCPAAVLAGTVYYPTT